MEGVWIGLDALQANLARLPKEVRQSPVLKAAASKALLPVKAMAKGKYNSIAKGSMEGGYSKARMLARQVVVRQLKSTLGARVILRGGKMVTGTRKGSPIRWKIWQYGMLMAHGAKGNRKHRGTNKSTGEFGGKGGDPIEDSARMLRGSIQANFRLNVIKRVNAILTKNGK